MPCAPQAKHIPCTIRSSILPTNRIADTRKKEKKKKKSWGRLKGIGSRYLAQRVVLSQQYYESNINKAKMQMQMQTQMQTMVVCIRETLKYSVDYKRRVAWG